MPRKSNMQQYWATAEEIEAIEYLRMLVPVMRERLLDLIGVVARDPKLRERLPDNVIRFRPH